MSEIDHNTAVRRIVRILKGPVAEVYRRLIPQFGEMSGDEFYELVLSRSDMLHGCVAIFHKHREAFDHLMKDSEGRVVRDDFVQLRCGRSVHDVIAMILRTHAKKQFRSHLGGDPSDVTSPSGRLYHAIKEYLIHDWQIALVPHYADLPVEMVQKMGPTLLECRTTQDVRALTHPDPSPTASTNTNTNANAVPNRDDEYWWETLNDPAVVEILAPLNEGEKRELTAAFCALPIPCRAALLDRFSLSLPQAALVLALCYRGMGRSQFSQILARDAGATAMAERLAASGLSSRQTLKGLAKIVEKTISSSGRMAGVA